MESEWTTEHLIIEYLQWLHPEVADRRPCVLTLDVHPAPWTYAVWPQPKNATLNFSSYRLVERAKISLSIMASSGD
jgi:hypothetical protein